jgi:hypothetical protein
MKLSEKIWRSCRAGVLIYALVIVALASLLLTGWIELMIVRGNQVNEMEQSIKRRLAAANGTALFRQYLLSQVLPGQSGVALAPVLVGCDWGGVSILNSWTGSPFASSAPTLQVNAFNPGAGGGFVLRISGVIENGGEWSAVEGLVQTRSPAASGRLITAQTPTLNPIATLDLRGGLLSARGSLLWLPSSPHLYNFATAWFATPETGLPQASLPGPGGTSILPSNLVWTPIFTTDYTGSLNVLDNPAQPTNSWAAAMAALSPLVLDGAVESEHGTPDVDDNYPITSDGNGTLRINLAQSSQNNFVLDNVGTLELVGDLSAPVDPLRILINQGAGPTHEINRISFIGSNPRPVLLGLKTATSPTVLIEFPAGSSAFNQLWLTVENTPLVLTSGSGGTWLGGLRTDRSVEASAADLLLQLPTDLAAETLLDRQGWVEIYQR